jgi:WXXGXW repeat (2 copies)
MLHFFCKAIAVAVLILLSPALLACASKKADQPKPENVFPYVQMAPDVPPAPYQESIPYPPDEPWRVVWRPGYWRYDGVQYFWVPGEYMARPTATASWSKDRWELRTYGWVFVPGYWQ